MQNIMQLKNNSPIMKEELTQINDVIARANVIDVSKINNEGKIIFGSTVVS